MSSSAFQRFRENLAVANKDNISTSYSQITKRLNRDFWNLDSELTHCLQVGSYGRHTAIRDVSDLDMVFELPNDVYERLSKVQGNGPSQLLQEIRDSIKVRYPNTKVKGDGQVVVVEFGKYVVEVLPAFPQRDGSYRYGDSNNGGSWDNYCWPRSEIAAVNQQNIQSNRNLKKIAKMLRAWKNSHGAPMSGMLIDTVVYNFFRNNTSYDSKSYGSYPELIRDIFTYIANLPEQNYWLAPGSNSRVSNVGKFQRKAKKAATKAQEALDEQTEKKKFKIWKELFGRYFPNYVNYVTESASFTEAFDHALMTEEFVEDKWPVDIRYELEIDYSVHYSGDVERQIRIKGLERIFPWLKIGRNLSFEVVSCNVPMPYNLYWKVRNVGKLAESKRKIRGQIIQDQGKHKLNETTSFGGEHFVECYAIKDGVCVARDKVEVPIDFDIS